MKKNIFEAEIVNPKSGNGYLNSGCTAACIADFALSNQPDDTDVCSDYTDCDGGYWCSSCTSGY